MFQKIIASLLIVCCWACANTPPNEPTQIELIVQDLSATELPSSIQVDGDLLLAKSWQDQNGDNLLVVSRKGPFQDGEYPEEMTAELLGAQYLKKENGYELLWDIKDFEKSCPFDLWIGLLPNSTSITDLDKDGITETTLVYKMSCRSDVTPSRMKLLMHEGTEKMGLRGNMILAAENTPLDPDFNPDLSLFKNSETDDYNSILAQFGRYENALDFIDQPSVLLDFAKENWLTFILKDEFSQLD